MHVLLIIPRSHVPSTPIVEIYADNCLIVEHRLHSSSLLESDQHHGIDNHYFSSFMYHWMGNHGGVQDDHIPFLQKGYLFSSFSVSVFRLMLDVSKDVLKYLVSKEHFLVVLDPQSVRH